MVHSHTLPRLRRGDPSGRELLSLRYIDGICFRRSLLAALGVVKNKVMAGGTPANPAPLDDRGSGYGLAVAPTYGRMS
jgi:hypothetical protein